MWFLHLATTLPTPAQTDCEIFGPEGMIGNVCIPPARDRPLLGPAEVPWLEEAVEKLDMIQQSAQKTISPREVKMWGLSI